MKTIKAKQTLHGSYGVISTGQTAEVPDKYADDLKERGLVDIESEGDKDNLTPEQFFEKKTLENNKVIGSIIEPKADVKTQDKSNKTKVTK